jgi:hypothetical protein
MRVTAEVLSAQEAGKYAKKKKKEVVRKLA